MTYSMVYIVTKYFDGGRVEFINSYLCEKDARAQASKLLPLDGSWRISIVTVPLGDLP